MVAFQCYLMHVWWNFWWWSPNLLPTPKLLFLFWILFAFPAIHQTLICTARWLSPLGWHYYFLFVLGFLSLLFFLLWILHRKSSSIFITTFRTKIVQTLHEFQNQFIYYSREFLKKLKWNFHSFFFPCASNQSWACLPMLSTVPKCKCFTQNQKMMVELQNLLKNQTSLLFTFKKLKLNAFECLMLPFEAF